MAAFGLAHDWTWKSSMTVAMAAVPDAFFKIFFTSAEAISMDGAMGDYNAMAMDGAMAIDG